MDDHLERILQLLVELQGTKPASPEHEAIIKKIRTLSDEFQAKQKT